MLLVAHRVVASAARAAELAGAGAGCFEIDVQVSGDRVVVSHFQPSGPFGRWVENDGWLVRRRRDVSSDPTLAEVLAFVPPDRRVLLDPKENDPARSRLLRERLVQQLPDRDRFVVSTSALADLEAYRRAGFGTWRTIGDARQLAEAAAEQRLPDEGISLRETLATAATVPRLRELVPLVVTWTVNDVERARTLQGLGVNGITTDRVEVMRALRD